MKPALQPTVIPRRRRDRGSRQAGQRGVATLIVVLVLFFVIAMVAAYTNRNLIFEQRTSANQARSTQALEAADAGLEWTLALLNHGRITATCENPAPGASVNTFRQRYLQIAANGRITPVADTSGELSAACVFNGTGWTCSCPDTGQPSVAAPSGTGVQPAFRVRFLPFTGIGVGSPSAPSGTVRVQVVGCTRADLGGCLNFDGQGQVNEGRAVVTAVLALAGRLTVLPQAALTARGSITLPGGAAYNAHGLSNGITLHAGGAVDAGTMMLVNGPGEPAGASSIVANEPGLALPPAVNDGTVAFSSGDRLFAATFNTAPEAFRRQQALIQLNCPSSGCDVQDLRTQVNANPGRPIWVNGDLNINSAGAVGSDTNPVVLVVHGEIVHATSGVTVHGLVYQRPRSTAAVADTWSTLGSGSFRGAVIAEGSVAGTGTHTFVLDTDLLTRVRWNVGSFVRAPGSWRDFQ